LAQRWQGLDAEAAYLESVAATAEAFLTELERRAEQVSIEWAEVIGHAGIHHQPSAVVAGFEAGTEPDSRAFVLEYGDVQRPPVSLFRTTKNQFDAEATFADRLTAELFG
jgi:hypothetical protein